MPVTLFQCGSTALCSGNPSKQTLKCTSANLALAPQPIPVHYSRTRSRTIKTHPPESSYRVPTYLPQTCSQAYPLSHHHLTLPLPLSGIAARATLSKPLPLSTSGVPGNLPPSWGGRSSSFPRSPISPRAQAGIFTFNPDVRVARSHRPTEMMNGPVGGLPSYGTDGIGPGSNNTTPQAFAPAPVTQVPFLLNATKWYRLGRLEYYLSAQNMAQDYFLRSKMDSQGWLPISFLASLESVRSLTEDEALVRELLSLSSVVDMNGILVRMKNWQAFVLPNAVLSHEGGQGGQENGYVEEKPQHKNQEKENEERKLYEVDDEEDDMIFVLASDEDLKMP